MIEKGIIWKFSLAFLFGVLVGLKLLPEILMVIIEMLVLVLSVIAALRNDVIKFFTYIPFAIYTEIFIRDRYENLIPYLTMQYFYITVFIIFILNAIRKQQPHTRIFVFLIIYFVFEFFNGFNPDRPKLLRSILLNSSSLILAAIWACYLRLTPAIINKFLASVKIAGLMLVGIVVVAQLTGKIDYGNFSNSDASNGLAPVQLSGYLSFVSILMFFSIMSSQEKKSRIIYLLAFGVVTMVMILTFSRGGLYFLGAIITVYLFYNRTNLGNYFRYLILIPIGLVIYNIAIEKTEGALLRRFGNKESSNRDVLVKAGFELFSRYPILGVGTSNFGTAIVRERLFNQESTAHNEFARAIAEHGIFGLITYWGFFISLIIIILKRKGINKQYSVYFFMLFSFILIHNGLKISLQQMLLILAIANPNSNLKNILRQPFKPIKIAKQYSVKYA